MTMVSFLTCKRRRGPSAPVGVRRCALPGAAVRRQRRQQSRNRRGRTASYPQRQPWQPLPPARRPLHRRQRCTANVQRITAKLERTCDDNKVVPCVQNQLIRCRKIAWPHPSMPCSYVPHERSVSNTT